MAAHRYWRLRGVSGFALGGGNYYWNVHSLEFYDKDFNVIPTTGGTALANAVFSGYPASNAVDSNNSTLTSLNANAAQAGTGVCYVGYDFGTPVDPYFMRYYFSSAVTGVELEYSDDGSSWTSSKSISGARLVNTWNLEWWQTPADTEQASKSYYRLLILKTMTTSGQNSSSAAEVELFLKTGGSDLCTGGTPFASDTYSGSFPASNAFDDNASTLWVSAANDPSKPKWVGYQLPSAQVVGGFSYRKRPSDGVDNESPWVLLQAGDSTSGPWYTIMYRDLSGMTAGEKRTLWASFSPMFSSRRRQMLIT